jgi:ketosteroid isomerase-like protein
MGYVHLIEAGRLMHQDLYGPDDRGAMIACYAGLGGGLAALGDRPPERYWHALGRAYAARDLDALIELNHPDCTLVDHRGLGWEPIRGIEQAIEHWRSGWAVASDLRLEVDEVLACDDRVIALRVTWRGSALDGGGELAFPHGVVSVLESGRNLSWDQYEHDDREAILDRYTELGGRLGKLEDGTAARVTAAYLRLIESRDVAALRAMLDPGVAVADHRALGGLPGSGPDAAIELAQSALGVTSELRFEILEIVAQSEQAFACTGRWVGRAAEGEGEVTVPMSLLTSVREERISSLELYEADDREAIRARFEELTNAHVDLARLRPYARFDRLYNERRLDEIPELYTDDFMMVDRRSMAWEEIRGGQALADTCRSFLENAPDLRSVCVPLIDDDGGDVVLLRNTFTGQGFSAGGVPAGPVELVFDEVLVIRGELMCRTELFDPADEQLARVRYEELRRVHETPEPAPAPGAR